MAQRDGRTPRRRATRLDTCLRAWAAWAECLPLPLTVAGAAPALGAALAVSEALAARLGGGPRGDGSAPGAGRSASLGAALGPDRGAVPLGAAPGTGQGAGSDVAGGRVPALDDQLAELVVRTVALVAEPRVGPAGHLGPATGGGQAGVAGGERVAPSRLVGLVFEAAQQRRARRAGGVFYTPGSVAEGLVEIALHGLLDGRARPAPIVLDPACGAGAFLLAAADRLHAAGWPAQACVAALRGVDIDAAAATTTRLALRWWLWEHGAAAGLPIDAIPIDAQAGDGLALLSGAGPGMIDAAVVVGNPPFLNQLRGATARGPADRLDAQRRFGRSARAYVDTAALFLLAALDAVRPGGRVVLVQPESTLAASHTEALRVAVGERATLEGMWLGGGRVFPVGVRVCAPVLRRHDGLADGAGPTVGAVPDANTGPEVGGGGSAGGALALWTGATVRPAGHLELGSPARSAAVAAGRWSVVLAAARGVPAIDVIGGDAPGGTLGSIAGATAGFRDQFYGLAPHVVEAAAGCDLHDAPAPLLTAGAIGLAGSWWGRRPVRFAGARWSRPVVDLDGLAAGNPRISRWVAERCRPKLLVATQTRVLNAALDPAGSFVPSVPVIAVEPHDRAPDSESLWLLAAALWSPVLSAVAAERAAGSGLGDGAIRLTARQILALPAPPDRSAWRAAAARLRDGVRTATEPAPNGDHLGERLRSELSSIMAAAYGLDDTAAHQVKRWWDAVVGRHRDATFL